MEWITLSLLSAFGQALGWALKKKTLDNQGINNTLGLVSFLVAGLILAVFWELSSETWPEITARFVWAALVIIVLNIVAVWTAYRALDKAALSQLMPFISLTALTIVPIEYLLRGVVPHALQIVGIAVVVIGTFAFTAQKRPTKESLTVAGYFAVTLLCYSITSSLAAVAVDESGSGLFSAAVFHLGIALGFVPLVIVTGERVALRTLQTKQKLGTVLLLMAVAGAVIALLENGPATVALQYASAAEVFSLKRTMPFFAMILGIFMFQEKVTLRHLVGTTLLVAGSILIVAFR